MASRAEDLARQFEAKANEATGTWERLSEADDEHLGSIRATVGA